MGKNVTTRILEESEYESWNTLVTNSPHGSIYSRPEYLEILCGAAGGAYKIVGCYRGEELIGVKPGNIRTPRNRYILGHHPFSKTVCS